MQQMQLSARAYDRILKVARTIADLAGVETIDTPQLAEAVLYRGVGSASPCVKIACLSLHKIYIFSPQFPHIIQLYFKAIHREMYS